MKEIWKDIKGYEGSYQVSNYGRVKSVGRVVIRSNKRPMTIKEKMIRDSDNGRGYRMVHLYKDGKEKNYFVHKLVWDHFKGGRSEKHFQIDHIDGDKHNNTTTNLQKISGRANVSKGWLEKKDNNLPTGVSKHSTANKYVATIQVNKKKKYLGLFSSIEKASRAYQKELKLLGKLNG